MDETASSIAYRRLVALVKADTERPVDMTELQTWALVVIALRGVEVLR